jgi:hypothetical protein
MTRLVAFWTTCVALAGGAFAVLLLEDRRLDVPMPYSLPLAFATMAVLAPLLLMAADALRARRPIRIEAVRPATTAPPPHAATSTPSVRVRRARAAEGVVLLDASDLERARGQAA